MHTQKISCLARIRPGEAKDSFGQTGSVYIQVVIDSVPDRIPLGIFWPVAFFDTAKEQLIERFEGDEVCYQQNLILESELLKASRLRLELYAAGTIVTANQFKAMFQRATSREDFIDFMIAKRKQLFRDGEISEPTYKNYWSAIQRVQEFAGSKYSAGRWDQWKFNTLTPNHIVKLEHWQVNVRNYAYNTMCGTMRVVHKMLGQAVKDGIVFADPAKEYKMPSYADGVRETLDLQELAALKKHYLEGVHSNHERDVLERYLVSCFTGLRKSDVEQLDTRIHIANGRLRLTMLKTRKYGKSVEFKLPAIVMQIIGKRRGLLFPFEESALINKTLRRIIEDMNSINRERGGVVIDKYIQYRSGRDTFATNFLRLGGMLVALKDILGHSSIKMTEIYVKMSSTDSDEAMGRFDDL